MSLDPPPYLNSLQNNIRARPIPWEGAVRAGTITDNDLKKIKAVDKVRKEQRKQTVDADTDAYRSLLIGGPHGKSVLESASNVGHPRAWFTLLFIGYLSAYGEEPSSVVTHTMDRVLTPMPSTASRRDPVHACPDRRSHQWYGRSSLTALERIDTENQTSHPLHPPFSSIRNRTDHSSPF